MTVLDYVYEAFFSISCQHIELGTSRLKKKQINRLTKRWYRSDARSTWAVSEMCVSELMVHTHSFNILTEFCIFRLQILSFYT